MLSIKLDKSVKMFVWDRSGGGGAPVHYSEVYRGSPFLNKSRFQHILKGRPFETTKIAGGGSAFYQLGLGARFHGLSRVDRAFHE